MDDILEIDSMPALLRGFSSSSLLLKVVPRVLTSTSTNYLGFPLSNVGQDSHWLRLVLSWHQVTSIELVEYIPTRFICRT